VSVVEASIEIEASVTEVWSVVADPRNLPHWDHRIISVQGVPPDGLRRGTTYSVTVRLVAARATIPAEVVDLRSEEYARVRLGGVVNATVETWLEPLSERRTRLRHRVDYRFRGGPLGGLAARAVTLLGAPILLRRGVEAQKRQVEASIR
jgi:hypothetical protein